MKEFVRKPSWLKVKSNTGEENQRVMNMLRILIFIPYVKKQAVPIVVSVLGGKQPHS